MSAPSSSSAASNTKLRSLLENNASSVFQADGVADIVVDTYEIDLRLAAMHRALVAHDALTRMLSRVDVPESELPTKLWDAIQHAERLGLINRQEVRWLKDFNYRANRAKHDRNLPF